MDKYIDADKLIVEIKKKISTCEKHRSDTVRLGYFHLAANISARIGELYSILETITSLQKDLTNQKQEWSEEDEKMFNTAIEMLNQYKYIENGYTGYFVAQWLISLRPQLKYEWSEEDEHYFQNLIMAVDLTFSDGNTKNWLQNRLKSLRPQPHWKPSKEQMEALKHCVDGWQDSADGRLESLYNDLLKKL